MASGSRKQITFDLSQDALKRHYPHKEPVSNPQYYKKAYDDVQRFMVKHGFEHRQYSVYVSKERLTTLDVVGLMEELGEQMPWLSLCVNEIDVTNIGIQHSLKQTLENAATSLDVDLESESQEMSLLLEPTEEIGSDNPKQSFGAKKRKHIHSQER